MALRAVFQMQIKWGTFFDWFVEPGPGYGLAGPESSGNDRKLFLTYFWNGGHRGAYAIFQQNSEISSKRCSKILEKWRKKAFSGSTKSRKNVPPLNDLGLNSPILSNKIGGFGNFLSNYVKNDVDPWDAYMLTAAKRANQLEKRSSALVNPTKRRKLLRKSLIDCHP